jgi:hypothetical protein
MASLHPSDGARMVLERASVDDAGAVYRVSVYEPEERLTVGEATLGDELELGWEGEPPPEWVVTFLTRFMKGLPKKHAAGGTWPRKITRWRAAR